MIRQTKHGFWVIDGDNWISKWAEESGKLNHDEYIIPQIIKYIPDGGVCIDAGSYIGDHTIAYARAVGPTGLVVAIDPNKEAIECLVKNLEEYKERLIVFNRYVSILGNDSAYFSLNQHNVGASKMLLDGIKESDSVGDIIQSISLDSLVGLIDRCDFLKIDIEGNEVLALAGARLLITMYRPVMFIEVNRGALQNNGTDFEEIHAALDSYGYSWVNIPNCPDTEPQYDILAIPNERK